jgi:hypothetical protein
MGDTDAEPSWAPLTASQEARDISGEGEHVKKIDWSN